MYLVNCITTALAQLMCWLQISPYQCH